MELDGRKALVLGMARTGEAVARFLLEKGAHVRCADAKSAGELGPVVRKLEDAGCAFTLGEHKPEDFLEADLIVLSPGVPMSLPGIREAVQGGKEVIGEVELAFRHLSCPLVGVTGTNGKTTTVSLIGRMLEEAGIPHWVGGNIGRPLIQLLLDRGEDGETPSPKVVIAELSSFQMESIVHFRPWIAAWTNMSDDHLDRYRDMYEYAEAKARIFMNQTAGDVAIVPESDSWLEEIPGGSLKARPIRFGYPSDPMPQVWVDRKALCFKLEDSDQVDRYDTSRVRLPGRHNLENMMVALAVSRLCGAPPRAVQNALEGFTGLEHRLEFLGDAGGIAFYNDSKATTVASVIRALEAFEGPVLLLAGGKDKGGDYTPLRESLEKNVRKLFLFGQAAGKMEQALSGVVEIEKRNDLAQALEAARAAARPGDTVLLSPACASFDAFRNYEERGRTFKGLVEEILRSSTVKGG